MTRIILVRHGQSMGNLEGYFQGRKDVALSDMGKKQAELVAKRLKNENIDIIVSSPLQRAYNTALCINKYHNVPLITDDNIIEISMGDWDGKYVSDMKEKYPEQMNDWWNNPHKFSAPDGESMVDVYSRVGSALQKIINNYREKTICIVSHGCAIRCMMCNIYNKPVTEINSIGWGDNTSVNIVECDGLYKNIKILVENDSKHLSSNFKCDTWVTK